MNTDVIEIMTGAAVIAAIVYFVTAFPDRHAKDKESKKR